MPAVATDQGRAAVRSQWKMPSVEMADEVLFYSDRNDARGEPAIISRVNSRTVNIVNLTSRAEYTGIRHRDDPDVIENIELIRSTGGVWGESSKMKELAAIRKAVEDMATEVGEAKRMAREALDACKRRGSSG